MLAHGQRHLLHVAELEVVRHLRAFSLQMKYLIIFMGFFSVLFGSCSKPQPPSKPLTKITVDGENDGFVDLAFTIRSHERLSGGNLALHAYGLHKGREVGITAILGTEWKKGSMGAMTTYQGTLTYQSVGVQSNLFLQILDQLYDTKLHPTKLRTNTTFTAISLEGEPAHLDKGPVRIKLFYESDLEDRYAELYTNIDLANGILQFHEKDVEYRSAVIHALSPE